MLLTKLRMLMNSIHDTTRYLQKFKFKTGGPIDILNISESIETSLSIQATIKSSLPSEQTYHSDTVKLLLLDFSELESMVMESKTLFNMEHIRAKSIDEIGMIAHGKSESVDSIKRKTAAIHLKIEELRLEHEKKLGIPVLFRLDNKEGMCIEIDSAHYRNDVKLRLDFDKLFQLAKKQPSVKSKRFKCLVFF